MRRAKSLAVWSGAATIAMVLVGAANAGTAQRRHPMVSVAVGELAGARVPEAFSRAVDDALADHRDVRVTPAGHADLVIRGSVMNWQRRRVGGALEVRCEVSLILADAQGGAIRAMLRGRGGARGTGAEDVLSQDALRAAVRGALRPLGQQGAALASIR